MSQIVQQVITPTFVDDLNVTETFVNGLMSFTINGPIATINLTVVRGDLEQSMKGQQVTKATATVAIRLAMPLQTAVEMKDLLNRAIQSQPAMAGLQIMTGSHTKQ